MSEVDRSGEESRSDDYVPGYLSTDRGFDPQTASFFYEPTDSAAATASSQHTLAKIEDSGQQPAKLAIIKEEDDETLSLPQRVPSGDYLAAQRQYQQNLLQRQQYLLKSGAVLQDRNGLHQTAEAEGARPQYSSRFVQPATYTSSSCYPRAAIYQQQNAAMANSQYQVGVPPGTVDDRVQPTSQRIAPQMIMPTRYSAGVQPAGAYLMQRISGGAGVQYAAVPVRYLPREGELQTPVYITPQGQATQVPPGTIVYMQDGRSVPIQPGQLAYTTVPLEYIQGTQGTPMAYDTNADIDNAVTKEEPADPTVEENTVKDGRKKRRLKRSKAVEGEDGATDVGTKKKRGRKRKKREGEDGEEDKQPKNAGRAQRHSLGHGELLKQKKRNMAFPKGTFLVRYADLDNEEYAGHIWLVDNHQLLQKYTYDGLDACNVKVFSRTERYSGWLCTCPWLYHPLPDVKGVFGNMEKVAITNYPTREELLARREEELLKAPRPEPTKESQEAEEMAHSDADHSEDEHEHEAQGNIQENTSPLPEPKPAKVTVVKKEEPEIGSISPLSEPKPAKDTVVKKEEPDPT